MIDGFSTRFRSPKTIRSLKIGHPLKEYLASFLERKFNLLFNDGREKRYVKGLLKKKFSSSKMNFGRGILDPNEEYDFIFGLIPYSKNPYFYQEVDILGRNEDGEDQYKIISRLNRASISNHESLGPREFFTSMEEVFAIKFLVESIDPTLSLRYNTDEEGHWQKKSVTITYPEFCFDNSLKEPQDIGNKVNKILLATFGIKKFIGEQESLAAQRGKKFAKKLLSKYSTI